MKVFVDCVGCEQRQLDAQRVRDYCTANGIELVTAPNHGDYSVLVTCAVDATSEDASLSRMEDILGKMGSSGKMLIGGCLPSISPEKVKEGRIAGTFSPRSMESLDDFLGGPVPMSAVEIPGTSVFDKTPKPGTAISAREEYDGAKFGYKIPINHGCLLVCSFCKIRDATGRLQSEPMEQIVGKFERAVQQKEPTIMLMGGDTGAWGYDSGSRFHTLLGRLLSTPGEYRVFIHDFNANWFIRDFEGYLPVFAANEDHKRLRAINFPVQSGSDRILRLMKRPYKAEQVIERLGTVKQEYPSIRAGTHVIVGFPGETESDFDATVDLLRRVDFDFVSCFAYSEHETAASAKLPGKVSTYDIDRRASRIADLFGKNAKIIR